MQSLLSPAVSVMSRLSYSKKFFILGLLSCIAVSVVVLMLYQNLHQVIVASHLEIKGLQQLNTLTKAVQKVQQHRGVSAAVLGGGDDFRGQLTIRTQEVNWGLDLLQREFASEKAPMIVDRLNNIKNDWSQIKQQGQAIGMEANVELHSKLIQELVSLKKIIVDSTHLALNNEQGTYQLILLMAEGLPKVLENMGQIRALGMFNLVQKRITPEHKTQLMVLKGRIEEAIQDIEDEIQQALNYNPMVRSALELTHANINNVSKLLTENIIPDIVQEQFTVTPGYFFNSVTFAQDSIYAQIYDSFLPITISLIEKRIRKAEQLFWISISIPSVLIALIAYFAMGAHLSVMRNVNKITNIAKAFADGDLRQRIAITHDDEMEQVAESFNHMADSFQDLLASRELDEIRFQRVIETAPDAVVQMNIKGEITGWNPQAEHIFGWKAHEVMGRLRHEVLIPTRFHETHLRSLQKFADHAEGNKLNLRFELIALHRDGHEFPVELTLTPQIPKSQEFISFIRDISQQKRSLQILKTSEQRYRALFESSRDATLTLNSAWLFVSANPAALALFGCENEAQLLEQSPVKLSPEYQPNGQLSTELSGYMIAKAMMKGSNSFEWVHQRLNGEYFFAEVNLSKVTFEDDNDIVLLVTIRDISERKIAEKAIVERESRFRNLFNAIPDFIFIMDMEGRFLDVNQSAYEFLGYEREELLSMNAAEIDTPEFPQKISERLKELQNQEYAFFESAIVKKNETVVPVEYNSSIFQFADKAVILAIARDLTERKRTDKLLRQREHHLSTILNSTPDCVKLVARDGTLLSMNPAGLALIEADSADKVLNACVYDLLAPEYTDIFKDFNERICNGESAQLEFEIIGLKGTRRWMETQAVPLRNDETEEFCQLAFTRDVTAEKLARTALINSEAWTRSVLRTMLDAVVQIDSFGKILLVNDAVKNLFGYEEEELLGNNVKLLMPEPYRSAHDSYLLKQRITKGRNIIGRHVEVEGMTKEGKRFDIELSVNELVADSGSTFIGVIHDITNRKAAEQAQETALREAERLAQTKSEFLANMSHEIRTPLNAIIGLAKMTVRENKGRQSEKNCSRICDAGLHLLSLVNDILDFSKIEAGKMSLDEQPFRLSALINDTLNFVEMRAKERQLELVIESAEGLPEWVMGDLLRLRQIIINLLSNAIKFTERGFVRLSVRSVEEGILQFSVTDSGIGISEEQILRLFSAFEQADSSTTRKYGGSGLGLAISQNLAHLMNGVISVKSATGIGSQFTLTVPLKATEAGIDPPIISTEDGMRLDGLKVFAAEDVELNRLVLEDILTQEGAQVVFAENGQQALDLLEEIGYQQFDVILMDIQMPIKDGYQTARKILEIQPNMPIIGLTAHAMSEEKHRCLAVGMRDHITKPIDSNMLISAILRQVSLKQQTLTNLQAELKVLSAIDSMAPIELEENQSKPFIDWEAVMRRFDGRQAFINKLITNFLDGTQQDNILKLRQAAAERDFKEIKFIAHSLKGLAGVFEAHVLKEQAHAAETAARDQAPKALEWANALADTLDIMLQEMRDYQEHNN